MDLVTADRASSADAGPDRRDQLSHILTAGQIDAASLTKKVLAGPDGDIDAFKETPGEMARRICREFAQSGTCSSSTTRHITAIREKPEGEEEKLEATRGPRRRQHRGKLGSGSPVWKRSEKVGLRRSTTVGDTLLSARLWL